MKKAGLLVLAGALVATTFASADPARQQDASFRSQAIGQSLHYVVYLPAGYATSGLHYPVVYFLHGLPSSATAYRGVGFVEKALDGLTRPAILVAPQGARFNEPDPEYVDHGPGDRWETAIAGELPRIVDARYRTIRSRDARALVGLSAGGFGAMHLALAHLGEFSAVESWSGYFHPTDPTGTKAVDLGAANNVHRQLEAMRARLARLPTYIAFYVGSGDSRFAAENEQLNQELARARIPHVFRFYPGGHGQALWGRYAAAWLSLALSQLAPAK